LLHILRYLYSHYNTKCDKVSSDVHAENATKPEANSNGGPMPKDERERRAQGERMRQAARSAGLTAYAIAAALDVRPTTVYRWWSGTNVPRPEVLEEYARITGATAAYLGFGSDSGLGDLIGEMVAFVDLVRGGAAPLEAYRRLGGDPDELPAEIREALEATPAVIAADLETAGGADWQQLTNAQKRALLLQVREIARRNREAGEPEERDTPLR
jgi:transcriptional regulator with XRE-family HTH domain